MAPKGGKSARAQKAENEASKRVAAQEAKVSVSPSICPFFSPLFKPYYSQGTRRGRQMGRRFQIQQKQGREGREAQSRARTQSRERATAGRGGGCSQCKEGCSEDKREERFWCEVQACGSRRHRCGRRQRALRPNSCGRRQEQ